MKQREQLIEDAAKAMQGLRAAVDGPHPANSGLDSFTLAHISHTLDMAEPQIRAVFEGAYTPTDDEREALAIARNIVNQIGDFYYERIPSSDWAKVRQETNDELDAFAARLILAHRTVQGEPCLAEHPITGRRCSEPVAPGHGHVCDLPPVQGEPSDAPVRAALSAWYKGRMLAGGWTEEHEGRMRAALRAAAETGGER